MRWGRSPAGISIRRFRSDCGPAGVSRDVTCCRNIAAQVVGAIVAAGVLYIVASGKAGFDASAGFASNGYGEHSPGGYSLRAALVTEVVMTFMFLIVILG